MNKHNELLKFALRRKNRFKLAFLFYLILTFWTLGFMDRLDADKIQMAAYEELFNGRD